MRLYRDGYTQEAIGEMFGITKSMVSRITGAKERTARVRAKGVLSTQELMPAHEQVLRKAPKPLQDKMAEVVLTRVESAKLKPKVPTGNQNLEV